MKTLKKITALFAVTALVITLFAGCGKSKDSSAAGSSQAKVGKKVGLILATGGLGDQSFNDLTFAGVKKAEKELGIKLNYVEPKAIADYETMQRQMASAGNFDIIIAVGFDQADVLKKIAAEFPKQNFAIIDSVVDAPNVASYVSEEQEGSFLVGALTGLLMKDGGIPQLKDKNVAGVVGGIDIPIINKFVAGYMAGAKYVNPSMNVIYDYAGGFSDPTTAKEISTAMYNKGAAVVYHAAGGSGLGVFQAAKEKNFLAIGCNSNQNSIDPEHIVASMMKRVDTATYSAVKDTIEGKFKAGVHSLGIAQDGIGYDLSGSKVQVPQSIVDQVNKLKDKMKNGEIKVPTSIDAVNGFLQSNKYSN